MFEFATLLSIACRIVCSASLVKSPSDPKNKPFFVFIYDYSTEIGVSAWKLRRCVLGIALILCVCTNSIYLVKRVILYSLCSPAQTPQCECECECEEEINGPMLQWLHLRFNI